MSIKSKLLALIAVFSLLLVVAPVDVAPVHAGILNNNPLAFNNGAGPGPGGAWTGSDVFNNGLPSPNSLIGNIDFSVFTLADFSTVFPGSGYVPGAGDGLVYTYQLENQGDFFISAQIVGISNIANAIGNFPSGAVAPVEVAPGVSIFDTAGNAIWLFSAQNIPTGDNSTILAYSSPNVPELGTGLGITVDGGTVGITTVPTPGSVAIPEPASVALLGIGLLGLLSRRRR